MSNTAFFRNATIYRLAASWWPDIATLANQLATQAFQPTGDLQAESVGWVQPTADTDLVYDSAGHLLLTMRVERKVIPGAAVDLLVRERAAEFEEKEGFKPGRKLLKEIKERVLDEMLPRAFRQQRDTRVWIDLTGRTLVIDSSSPAQCDQVLGLIGKCLDPFPLEPFLVQTNPALAMTAWLQADAAPDCFTIDTDVELRGQGDQGPVIRYQRQAVDPNDVGRHIHAGKVCTLLGLTWNDRVAMLLTDTLVLKRIVPLDLLTHTQEREAAQNAAERYAADFKLMTGEMSGLIGDLTHALGGLQDDLAQRAARDTAPVVDAEIAPDHGSSSAPLLYQAREYVIANDRASISLIQRHLGIGYNRAARLLETLEQLGVVSPMTPDGKRAVLA
ncbi:recombination-associated protein RdgC [Orrella sp. JC864]|uniref:recombination-associated protein RdgC n=1 Tax=Orrella sp. JC864 TaxID=3120298 RepID=UPI00300B772C